MEDIAVTLQQPPSQLCSDTILLEGEGLNLYSRFRGLDDSFGDQGVWGFRLTVLGLRFRVPAYMWSL